eukprot:COSAG06_NODE_1000_length_11145_cov_9.091526_8_plen_195_part_00
MPSAPRFHSGARRRALPLSLSLSLSPSLSLSFRLTPSSFLCECRNGSWGASRPSLTSRAPPPNASSASSDHSAAAEGAVESQSCLVGFLQPLEDATMLYSMPMYNIKQKPKPRIVAELIQSIIVVWSLSWQVKLSSTISHRVCTQQLCVLVLCHLDWPLNSPPTPLAPRSPTGLCETSALFQPSLCLSRACLGK